MIERGSYTVLVVDDEPAQRYALVRTLEVAGFKTAQAATGTDAMQAVDQVDAVVLDVHLPDIHGFELCRMLRLQPDKKRLPVIHVSAVYVAPEDHADGANAGADAYLVAPPDPDRLVRLVDLLLLGRNLLEQHGPTESTLRKGDVVRMRQADGTDRLVTVEAISPGPGLVTCCWFDGKAATVATVPIGELLLVQAEDRTRRA